MPATATKPRINYPRPPVTVLHTDLFREPEYTDGEPYDADAAEEDGTEG